MKDGYIVTNRELSWLDFNFRVLDEARDMRNPLFERLKFLAITSSNLDEFFMVRVATLNAQIQSGYEIKDASELTAAQQLELVLEKTHEMAKLQTSICKDLMRELEEKEIRFLRHNMLSANQKDFCTNYFYKVIQPVLTPLAVDASRPFPEVMGRSVNLAVRLNDKDGNTLYALVQVPSLLPRYIKLEEENNFVLIEDIILIHISSLFEGYTIKGVALFRVTRDGDLEVDDDVSDLMDEIQKLVQKRRRGQPVRVEIMKGFAYRDEDMPLINFLKAKLNIKDSELFMLDMPLDLTFLFGFSDIEGFSEYKFKPQPPLSPLMLKDSEDIFETISERDILVQHPYESFDCVVDFINQAADDPDVLAIKQTLYRVSGNSPIVAALIRAVQSGKQVTVLVELKARFDEENNIAWAKTLEQAGCHVIYGLVGLKVHSKVLLVVRREQTGIKRYLHISTGNYNDSTAKVYTDTGLFTCNEAFCADASALFNMLTGYSVPSGFRRFKVAPTYLKDFFTQMIENEIASAREGKPAYIVAKVNSLIDPDIIYKLYEASEAGVKIELIVRGINGLRSAVEGLSDNIRVRSIVGRYLEHDRIYKFHAGGKNLMFIGSADLMPRNLVRRVEIIFPITDSDIKKRLEDTLAMMLRDNVKARMQLPDGSYEYIRNKSPEFCSQEMIYNNLAQSLKDSYISQDTIFIPIKGETNKK